MEPTWQISNIPVVRRVVTGIDGSGRSTVVSDGPTEAVVPRPDGPQVMDIWRMPLVPPTTSDGDRLDSGVVAPDLGGLVYRLCWVAPNDNMDPAAYACSMARVYGHRAVSGGAAMLVGGHATETVDVVTAISGEVIAVFENDEVVLQPGDSLVQRGAVHGSARTHRHGDGRRLQTVKPRTVTRARSGSP